jgi:hypothetical protein
VNDDLHEHVDGVVSAFPRPGAPHNFSPLESAPEDE